MPTLENVTMYCFSGTGNTLLVAHRVRDGLRAGGVDVSLRRMETSDPSGAAEAGALGVAFPVACQSTYPLVWRFLNGLPVGEGKSVFMVDTLHAFSGGIVGPLRRLFETKGYTPIGAAEIAMPSNFVRQRINPTKKRARIECGLKRADEFVSALLAGTATWGRFPCVSDVVAFASRSGLPWLAMRPFLAMGVKREECTGCGTCAKLCPVGNIEIKDYPVFGRRCELCMRCLGLCPEGAIKTRLPAKPYSAVEATDLLSDECE